MPTLKESLDEALEKLSETESKLVTAEQSAVDLKTKAEKAEKDFKTEQEAHTKTKTELEDTKGKLSKVETELGDLKASNKTADQRVREELAASGITIPAAKNTPEALNKNAAADAALWERYQNASPTEKAQMRAEHGKKLDAAATAWDAEHSGK